MYKSFSALALISLGLVSTANQATAQDTEQLTAEARGLVKAFAGQLKPQLKQAISEGGPTRAIEVCASQAPKIADALSTESGWTVRRVSLKTRNASRAQADAWERGVLEAFDQRAAAGEQPPALNYSEMTQGQFRYMQAQVVEGVCLLCHGENIDNDVSATLREYYPDDDATGYALGQVRGAISLAKDLDNNE